MKREITLGEFLAVCGAGSVVHIGTEYGRGWWFTGTCLEALSEMTDWMDRKVTWIYFHEGRQEIYPYCCELKPGFGVRVDGCENGMY
jgi:hypothetical protein